MYVEKGKLYQLSLSMVKQNLNHDPTKHTTNNFFNIFRSAEGTRSLELLVFFKLFLACYFSAFLLLFAILAEPMF